MFIVYIIVLIAALMFCAYFYNVLSVITLICVLLLPIASFILLIITRVGIKADFSASAEAAMRGQTVGFEVKISNKTFLSCAAAEVRFRYKSGFYGNKGKLSFAIPIYGNDEQVFKFDVPAESCGMMSVEFCGVKIFDQFRCFFLYAGKRKMVEIPINPKPFELSCQIDELGGAGFEADIFSKAKSGDDNSEIFNIREYMQGDRLNRIHWNLSLKQDSLMVREYSLPLNGRIVVMTEPFISEESADFTEVMDRITETAFSFSVFLCENEIPHFTAAGSGNGCRCEKIGGTDDLIVYANRLITARPTERPTAALESFLSQYAEERFSHLIYVVPKVNEEMILRLEEEFAFSKITVISAENAVTAGYNGRITVISSESGEKSEFGDLVI